MNYTIDIALLEKSARNCPALLSIYADDPGWSILKAITKDHIACMGIGNWKDTDNYLAAWKYSHQWTNSIKLSVKVLKSHYKKR